MREQLTDVTLACGPAEDQQLLSAHSLMLSVCSPYFRTLLAENRHKEKHHIIHLGGVTGRHMQQLLVYMYRGEISISQEDLGPLIDTAKCLQIKGLAMAQPNVNISASPPPPPAQKKRSFSQLSPVPPNVQINVSPTFPSSNSTPIPPQQLSPNRLSKKSRRALSTSPYKEETVLSSQECPDQNIKGEIPEEKTEPCLEINAMLPDVPLPDSFLSPKSNRSSQLVVSLLTVKICHYCIFSISLEFTHTSETIKHLENRRDEDLFVETDLDWKRRPATSIREPGDQTGLVASTHPALG